LVKGADLSKSFYEEAVKPIAQEVVGEAYLAARIDGGSEVLGFDDEMSRDHDWGPRLQLLLPEVSDRQLAHKLDGAMRQQLPPKFHGYSTSFSRSKAGDDSRVAVDPIAGEIEHFIDISTLPEFLSEYIGMSSVDDLSESDWLSLPSQKLRTLSSGPVFYDGIGFGKLQDRLAFYPENVWMYLMAAEWARLAEEEPFIGRTGMVGDEIGSRIIASRLLMHAMRLVFLMDQVYAPYSKWFGSEFRELSRASSLTGPIERVQVASDWRDRESAFVEVVIRLGELHNELRITERVDPSPRNFHDRPFRVVDCERFASALKLASHVDVASGIWSSRPIGGIDTFSDSTDLLEDAGRRSDVVRFFD